jgi:Secretion system C-terminal sorting domain
MTARLLIVITLCSLNPLFSQTANNLLYETFGSGINITTPGIAPSYCWNNQNYPAGRPCGNTAPPGFSFPSSCGSYTLEDNQYVVTSALNPNNCNWFAFKDHTSSGGNSMGRFLAINIGQAAGTNGVLYSKYINSVIPNQEITIELFVGNLIKIGVGNAADPVFTIELVDANDIVVVSQSTGLISKSNSWQLRTFTVNPGNNTSLNFKIRSASNLFNGNDAVIDDIKISQLPILGLSETVFDKVSIYPNPTPGEFHIDNVALEKVTIYNTLGNLVKELSFANSLDNTINLATLSKGIYFINLQAEGEAAFKKIIVE